MAALSTPAAIVSGLAIAGLFTGLGLYFGLRGRPVPAGPSPDASASAAATIETPAVAVAPTTAPSPEPTISSGPSPAALEARSAVAAEKEKLLHDCWEPSLALKPSPAQVTITVSLEYLPDGHLSIRSLQQDPTASRADVSMCVDKELRLGPITPPGRRVHVSVPLTFP